MSITIMKFFARLNRSHLIAIICIVACGIVGTRLLLVSHADTPAYGIEAEAGTASSSVTKINDTSASGGSAIKFGSNVVTPPTSSTCPAYPQFPNASCTGASGSLTAYTGSMNFTTANQVVKDKLITIGSNQMITVSADNVTFSNVKIVYNGAANTEFSMLYMPAGVTGTSFDHCEFDGAAKSERAIQGSDGVTVSNCNIHDVGNGIEVGSNITATDNYIWNIDTPDGFDWHADGIQTGDSSVNCTITHNTILLTGGETGSINMISNDGGGTVSNVLIQNNLFAGGSYNMYVGTSAAHTSNVKVLNNHFSTRYYSKVGQYGVWYGKYLSTFVHTGNVIDETGATVDN